MIKQANMLEYRQRLNSYVERRSSVRYPFAAAIEAVDVQRNIRMTGRVSDISRQGCYIGAVSPFVKNAEVTVSISKDGQSFRAGANIIYSITGIGMGLAFTTIEPDQLPVLEGWLEVLSNSAPEPQPERSAAPGPARSAALPQTEAKETGEPALQQVVVDLIALLKRKNVVSEAEGTILLQKLSK